MNTAYKNISDTNTAFGNLFGCCVEGGTIVNYEKIYNQAVNLYDELDELRDDGFALLVKDKISKGGREQVIDAVGDLTVFLYGIPHFLGLDYTEKTSDKVLLNVLGGLKVEESFLQIYEDLKTLIDDLVNSIQSKESLKDIMVFVKDIDIYLATICELFKFDLQVVIDRVTISNMSKLCKNEKEVLATLDFYRSKGVDVYSGESPLKQSSGEPFNVVYSSKEQEVGGKIYRAHKFLKCVNWFEPDLSDL